MLIVFYRTLGQSQNGVDIYGIPNGYDNYWGIQCKGKDDYANSQLSEKEIDDEIEKAKNFKPKLDYFIFTTTANKDAKIEEYVRVRNIDLRKNNYFSIDLFSWEDIVDLIETNKNVYEWYLKDILHKNNYAIKLVINGSDKEVTLEPEFEKINLTIKKPQVKRVIDEEVITSIKSMNNIFSNFENRHVLQAKLIRDSKKYDLSYVKLDISFYNTGDTALEYYKINIYFNSEKIFLNKKNYEHFGIIPELDICYNYDYFIDNNSITYVCNNNRPILVPKDGRGFSVFIKLLPENYEFNINYELLSKDFYYQEDILCKVKPRIEEKNITRYAEQNEEESYSERIIPKTYYEEKE